MNLTQELANFRAQFKASQSEEIKGTMEQATQDLINSEIVDNALKQGDTVPNFILPNAVGKPVTLSELLQQGAVVISFYRGGWCPYCNLELRALQQYLPKIQAAGANLVAISPQTPDNSLSTAQKNELTFEVLSDVSNQVAREFGLVFTLPAELRPIYAEFGIDLPAANGDDTFELPIPATYVVAPDGKIVHAFVNPDYTQRLEPEAIVQALKELSVAAIAIVN